MTGVASLDGRDRLLEASEDLVSNQQSAVNIQDKGHPSWQNRFEIRDAKAETGPLATLVAAVLSELEGD